MHVLILTAGPDPYDPLSSNGPSHYVRSLVHGLRNLSAYRVSILCLIVGGSLRKMTNDGVDIWYVPESRWLRTLFTPLLYKRAVQKVIRLIGPDIIDLYAPSRAGLLNGLKVPYVVTVHGLLPEQLNVGLLPKSKAALVPLYLYLWWRGLRHARRLLVLSNYDRSYLARKIETPISVVAVPRAPEYFTEKSERKNSILSVGNISARKNQLAVLDAFSMVKARIPDARLTLVGRPAERNGDLYLQALFRKAAELHLESSVSIRTDAIHSDVIEEYRHAAVYVQFSCQESLPATIVEALASGTPIVAANIPSMREAIEEGHTGFLVNPDDAMMLAEKLLGLLTDDRLRERIGFNARATAREKFASKVAAKQHADAYLLVMAGQG